MIGGMEGGRTVFMLILRLAHRPFPTILPVIKLTNPIQIVCSYLAFTD